MIVIATDAPVLARNLERLGARAIMGLARTGSSASNGSGDYVLAFSTNPRVRRNPDAALSTNDELGNDAMSALFQAVTEATEEALACLREPELGGIWLKPVGAGAVGLAMEVWRERTFELVLDGNWVTGIFDRVMVVRRADGQGVGATVVDFKTDRLGIDFDWAKAAAKHSAQLNLYRRVVSILTGIPLNQVQCEIVFTRRRRRVPVSFQK